MGRATRNHLAGEKGTPVCYDPFVQTASLQSSHLLDAQLDLLRDEVERWGRHGKAAALEADVDDLIALALETVARIRLRCDAYNRSVGATPTPQADALLAYWRRWHDIAERALQVMEQSATPGGRSERAREFRFAINEAALAKEWEKIQAARESGGRVRSLEEIEDEISHQSQ
jgi:hypothetical protein